MNRYPRNSKRGAAASKPKNVTRSLCPEDIKRFLLHQSHQRDSPIGFMERVTHPPSRSSQKPRSPPCHPTLSAPQPTHQNIFPLLLIADISSAKSNYRPLTWSSGAFTLVPPIRSFLRGQNALSKGQTGSCHSLAQNSSVASRLPVGYEIGLIWALIFPALAQVTLPLAPMYPHPAEHPARNKHSTRLLNG